MRATLWWRVLTILVAAVTLVAACGDADDGDSSASADTETTAADFDAMGDDEVAEDRVAAGEEGEASADDGDAAAGGAATANPALQPADIGRDLIFTAELEVVVDDVAAAGAAAQQKLEGVGGLLFGQQTSSEPRPRSVLTFKVPPSQFSEALNRLGEIGTVRDQQVRTDDVTDRLVDLESQIRSMELSVERLREFLQSADSVQTVAALENELLDRETRLELLRGQERTIEGQVALATITLTISQRIYVAEVLIDQTVYQGHDGGAGCPGRSSIDLDDAGPVTVCYFVTNDGDRVLSEVAVVDEGLEIRDDDVVLVRGSTELEPGATATFMYELDAEHDVLLAASVRAVTADDEPVSNRAEPLHLSVPVSDDLPGFGDSLGAGVDLLLAAGSVLLLVIGFSIPFLWVPAVVLLVVWVVRRRRPAHEPAEVDDEPAEHTSGTDA